MATLVRQEVQYKKLNKGKTTNIYHDYDKRYFDTQFAEIFQEEHYKSGLKKDAVYLDLGANIGLSVLYFKDYAKKIYAVEPNSDYFNFLKENTKDLKNVECFNVGIGAGNGLAYLYGNPGEERTETIFGQGENKMPFTMLTIDKFFEDNKIEHIDVLKIDVEGSEYPIFMSEGFRKVANKIDYIIGEAHFATNLRPEYLPTILEEYGFKVKFFPFKNMFNAYSMIDGNGKKVTKEYKTYSQTVFEAYRE